MFALQAALLLLLGAALSQPAAVSVSEAHEQHHAAVGQPVRVFEGAVNRFDQRRLRRLPPPPPPHHGRRLSAQPVDELYLEQVLDHFNPTDSRTWQQRYFRRTDMYEEGGPVFIYIGGEGQESAQNLGDLSLYMIYMAQVFRAKVYDLEHRFYGKSHPLPDLSTKSLQYLSADQALADLAYFIESLKKSGELEEGQNVAVFGGSYPGNLAAWARMKYPHLVKAAISSSAPVHAKADFVEYMEVVGRSLSRVAGQFCYDNVKKATDRIVELLKTPAGQAQIKKVFYMSSSTDLNNKLDLDAFFETLSNPFAGAVQYNRKNPPNSKYNIKYICSFVAGDDLTPDQAVSKLSALVVGDVKDPTQTLDWSYKSTIKQYQGTEYIEKKGVFDANRQWLYQTCTEFGYYQTFSGSATPFPAAYNDIDYSYQECKDLFGEEFGEKLVSEAVERTNLVFGDRAPDVTNVLFVNGNIDPWHALGILHNVTAKAPAFVVDGGSHCADMDYPDSSADSEDIKTAHEMVHQFLRATLYEVPDGDPADG